MNKQCSNDSDHIELKMPADPEYLSAARGLVRAVAQLVGLDETDAGNVTLAVVEALTNVIRHSYGGPCSQPIILTLTKTEPASDKPAALTISIRDFGAQVHPDTIKGRHLDDVKPGGLGVHIIKSVMDEAEYSPADDGGMQLRMAKYLIDKETCKQ